jgi:membrane associated rhomboid family serine protease
MFRIYWRIKFVNLSARNMFLVWFGLQLVGVWRQIEGFSNVSALAHLGGVAVGALFWFAGTWRNRDKEQLYNRSPYP